MDWVVQADCPEDAAAYIHRVGRTARCGRARELCVRGRKGLRGACGLP